MVECPGIGDDDFDEQAAVEEIAGWAEQTAVRTKREASRAYFRDLVQRLLASGEMSYSEALRKVAGRHHDIDVALREHVGELLQGDAPLPRELREFAKQALLHPPVTYGRGNAPTDDFARNIVAHSLVFLAISRWPHLKETRAKESRRQNRRASACSLVAEAMNRSLEGCNFSEGRVEQIVASVRSGRIVEAIAS
jgi:hypothetical protein